MVLDEHEANRVTGMLTERDYLRFALHADALGFFGGSDPRQAPVSKIMTPFEKMTSLKPDATVKRALQTVQHRIFRHLPIVDDDKQLLSIIDIRDLILLADGGRTDDERREPPGGLRSVWDGKKAFDVLGAKRKHRLSHTDKKQTLADYLLESANRHEISGSASIAAAAKQMDRENLTFLIVVEGPVPASTDEVTKRPPASVIGLVNERDFTRYSLHDEGTAGGDMLRTANSQEVSTIMTPLKDVVHVSLSDSVSKCLDILFSHNVRHLPVIDGAHLSGIISLRDILRPILEAEDDE